MFTKTNDRIRATLNGWDGKSYEGEGTTRNVYTLAHKPDAKFIRAYNRPHKVYCYFIVTDERHSKSGEFMAEYYDHDTIEV
ncbi:hypothetical protein FACS1894184_18050 [Clostridia bacterium]|nr:hypothetical protein FACS1894184_18050 [Clostridia bacterium]